MTVSFLKGPAWLAFVLLASIAAAQEGELPPNYPEELLPTGEPPATLCDCEYLATTQPSQGVLQDDPKDLNLLVTQKGKVTLSSVLQGIHPPNSFRVPTQEAILPMVANRTTFILAASPYNRLPAIGGSSSQAFPNAADNFTKLKILGRTKFSQNVLVQVRTSVYLNGNRVNQFLITKTPKAFPLAGSCDNTFRDIDFEVDMLENHDSGMTKFKFTGPGDYVIRTELVYHDENQADISKLRPTGIAFDVFGKVEASKVPKIHLVPVVLQGLNGPSYDNYHFGISQFAIGIGDSLQDYMAIPSGKVPVTVQKTPIQVNYSSTFNNLSKQLKQAARQSGPTAKADLIIAVVEEQVFDDWLYNHAPGTNFYSQNEFVAGIHGTNGILMMRGHQRVSFTNPVQFRLPNVAPDNEVLSGDHFMQYIVAGLTRPVWKEVTATDDCQIANYIGELNTPGFGVNLQENRADFTYAESPDLMSRASNRTRRLCQCTYRHTFRALKKNKLAPSMVVVRGTAYRYGFFSYDAILDPSYRVEGESELEPNGTGSWRIVFRNHFGLEIASYPFTPPFDESPEFDKSAVFNFTLPAPLDLGSIEIEGPALIFGGPPRAVFDALDVSLFTPKIQSFGITPLPGPDQLDWQVSDNDGDPLLYTVLFSDDGSFFYPTDIFETTANRALIDIPFGVVSLKLIATDGTNSDELVIPRWNFP